MSGPAEEEGLTAPCSHVGGGHSVRCRKREAAPPKQTHPRKGLRTKAAGFGPSLTGARTRPSGDEEEHGCMGDEAVAAAAALPRLEDEGRHCRTGEARCPGGAGSAAGHGAGKESRGMEPPASGPRAALRRDPARGPPPRPRLRPPAAAAARYAAGSAGAG